MLPIRTWRPGHLPSYPHFNLFDAMIWDSFITENPDQLEYVSYDVTVGNGRSPLNFPIDYMQEDWTYLTSLKIDALGFRSDILFLYEVKIAATPCAIGQLFSYRDLLPNSIIGSRKLNLTIICTESHPDIIQVCNDLGIRIIITSVKEQKPVFTILPPQK